MRRPVGPLLMSPAGTGFAELEEDRGFRCLFWLEGAPDLAQICLASQPFDSSCVTGSAAVVKL